MGWGGEPICQSSPGYYDHDWGTTVLGTGGHKEKSESGTLAELRKNIVEQKLHLALLAS